MAAKIKDIRGSAAGVQATEIADGQRLYDLDNRKLYIDRMVDETPERVEMSLENTFSGTKAQWNALSNEQRAIYKYVDLLDDYEFKSDVFIGATAETDGNAGLVPAPKTHDRNSYLKGDGTWDPLIVDDTLDTDSANPIMNKAVANALDNKIDVSARGVANGIAELDLTGKLVASQMPSTVGYVVEAATASDFPTTGDIYTMYIALDTNKVYRWSGSVYVEISASLALGETSSTAFRGDYGRLAYDHAVTNKGIALSSGLYKIVTNSEGHVEAGTAVTKNDITSLGIPGSDTTYSIRDVVGGTYASLAAFVQASARGKLVTNFQFTDASNIFGFGQVEVKGTIHYEKIYNGTNEVNGNGLIYLGDENTPYWIKINGTSTFTLSKSKTYPLKSELKSTLVSTDKGSTANREYAVGPDKNGYLAVNVPWTDTTYTNGAGLTLSSGTFSLANSGATAGSYGPSADVTGTNGTTIKVPYITVDVHGRVTSITEKTYTSVDNNTTALTSMTGTLAVSHGGTGATAAKAARANLVSTRIVYNGSDPYASCNNGDVWIAS